VLELDFHVPLGGFDLRVEWRPEATALGLFGPSGSGKTTALESIAGLQPRAMGSIRFAGESWLDSDRGVRWPAEERGVGYVPQDLRLFPHWSVGDNIRAGQARAATAAVDPPLPRVLEVLEIGHLLDRPIGALSGGEQQRVAVARALASGPRLLLLDEPLTGLDQPLRRRVLDYLLRVREEFGVPTLHVSHDLGDVRLLATQVALLKDGRVVATGRSEDVLESAALAQSAREAGFENLITATVATGHDGWIEADLEPGLRIAARGEAASGDLVTLALPAAMVLLARTPPTDLSAGNRLEAVVESVRASPTGNGMVDVLTRVGARHTSIAASVLAASVPRFELKPGARVHLIFAAHACRVVADRQGSSKV